ncbi:MAG: sporulation protein YqfD [Lawsonibacter sp.]|nr:sporulation protein YqfD [Lawsonibacter sp.]
MKRLMNFLRGMVTLRAEGPYPERLINLCAQEGVEFWGVEWLDETTIRFTARRRSLSLVYRLTRRAGCQAEVEGSHGLPDFLLRFRTRYAFLVGLALSLCAVAFLSRFVLTIQVTGNQRVPTAVILSQLRQLGVYPGVYGPGLDRKQLAQEALLGLEDLAWMGINLSGTRLEVIVREVVETPKRVDETECYDIVAEADGIITHVEAELGEALVQEGDTVLAGEVLISGLVSLPPPQYTDLPTRYFQTHARGRVWARTWRTLTAAIPLEAQVKVYTGEERSIWSLCAMGRRLRLWGEEGDWERFDRTAWTRQAVLPGEVILPLTLNQETLRAYQLQTASLDMEAAQSLLEEELRRYLDSLLGEDGEVETVQFSAKVEEGMLCVTLQAECQEEIGKEILGSEAPPS